MVEFQEKTGVVPNTETEILNFTNSTGNDIFIQSVGGQGTGRAEWFFYIESVLKVKRRTNAALINVNVPFKSFTLPDSQNITVKVIQYESSNQDFSSEMIYLT